MQAIQTTAPIQFGDFVQAYGGSSEHAKDVPQSFYTSPSVNYFPTSEYRKKEFTKNYVNGAVAAIFQHVIHPVSIDTGNYSRKTYNELVDALGFELFNADELTNHKAFWFDRAATFQFCPYASCAWRASYAAVKIARVFENTDFKIYLKSAETKDQFTVVVGNAKSGWFVYDPLTNPDVVFPLELYNKKIIGTFSDRRRGSRKFSLQITLELIKEYSAAWPRMQKLYMQYCENTTVTVESLKNDPALIAGLQLGGVKPANYDKVCLEAIKVYKEIVSQQRNEISVQEPV